MVRVAEDRVHGRLACGGSADGVLVIDKPVGPTSHDVVARMRKVFDLHAVGHAGTLDPEASGVLVVAIGQATKLAFYLTQQDKRYAATVTLGTSTTTLDREGAVVATGSIPNDLATELARGPLGSLTLLEDALDRERRRKEQVPPAFSAIKQGGRAVHKLARRGEEVILEPRAIEVKSLEITETSGDSIGLLLVVSKGYYVRALARDLGETLGVPAHLSSLRRTASGPFSLEEALPLDSSADELHRALQPVARVAARVLPVAELSAEGMRCARHGKALAAQHFSVAPPEGISAWFGPEGELVAIGRAAGEGTFAVQRGFSHSTSSAAT
jgi:tRNA pseudouridine55 synthase